VEDNRELAGSLGDFLEQLGYEVDFAFNGLSALQLLRENNYDAVVLDVMMPNLDGLKACRAIRDELHLSLPIIFLTARDAVEDKIAGFEAGGDDYLVKPFSPEELDCRINALLRRRNLAQRSRQVVGDLELDHSLHKVWRQGKPIELREIQFQLLVLLINAAPEAVPRQTLERTLWPAGFPDSDPLRTHIYRLRANLDRPFDTKLLHTVHGRGYRIAIPY
jgi:DNA-binding response OmpR family regulator